MVIVCILESDAIVIADLLSYELLLQLATPGTVLPFTFRNKIEDVDPDDSISYSMVSVSYCLSFVVKSK